MRGKELSFLEPTISSSHPSPFVSEPESRFNEYLLSHMLHKPTHQDVWGVFLEADSWHWVVNAVSIDGFAVPSISDDVSVSELKQGVSLGVCGR